MTRRGLFGQLLALAAMPFVKPKPVGLMGDDFSRYLEYRRFTVEFGQAVLNDEQVEKCRQDFMARYSGPQSVPVWYKCGNKWIQATHNNDWNFPVGPRA